MVTIKFCFNDGTVYIISVTTIADVDVIFRKLMLGGITKIDDGEHKTLVNMDNVNFVTLS